MAAEHDSSSENHHHHQHNGHIHRDGGPPAGKHHASASPSSNRRSIDRKSFPSYISIPNLPPKISHLCGIIATTPSLTVEQILDGTGIAVTQEDVEQVLKLSYSFPAPAVKFFRWSGILLGGNHSAYAWNLVVDLLGKNSLFDAMWDCMKSMRRKSLISLATFASVFSSYVLAARVKEAVMTFEVMDLYGCSRDVVALNSLLSAICRDGRTVEASDFLRVAQRHIRPDSDSFAILLEGWEKEMNVVCSRETFAEMIEWVGWDRGNVPAYDAFLCTLLMEGIIDPLKYLEVMRSKGCCPGIRFLASAVEECSKRGDIISADSVWETMVDGFRIRPDARLHSMMIELHCCSRNTDRAVKLFDETVRAGLFPNVQACNMLFELLIEARRLKEGSALVNEMMRNEYALTQTNCSRAVMVYLESRDAYMAILIWKLMVERYKSDLEGTGNGLVVGLIDLQFVPEAVVYAEGMIEKGIKLTLPTISKLKESLIRERKEIVFEKLLRKWTSSHG